ncbi:MAG: YaaC family protein [Proteobacteria bacterium]|nr:YaaC family protein [Pseudomonadota bacterium]
MPRLPKPRDGEPAIVKGKMIPFSFWPDNYLTYGKIAATDPWQCMNSFVASAKKIEKNILVRTRSYIQQSQEFFTAATQTSINTRPLMLYYSYLNLAKAFLIFRRKKLPKRYLHGVTLGSLPIRFTGLNSLRLKMNPPRNTTYRPVFGDLIDECGFVVPPGNNQFSISQLAYQLAGIHDIYVATKQKSKKMFPVELSFMVDKKDKTAWIHGAIDIVGCSGNQKKTIRDYLKKWSSIKRVQGEGEGESKYFFETQNAVKYGTSSIEILREKIVSVVRKKLFSEQTHKGFKYYLFCEDHNTAQVAANYGIMFILGHVVRYAPELIEKLEKEWIIHEYLATQPFQLVYLLGSGMIRNDIVPMSI